MLDLPAMPIYFAVSEKGNQRERDRCPESQSSIVGQRIGIRPAGFSPPSTPDSIPSPTLTFFTLLPWPLAQMGLSDMDPAAQADLRSRRAGSPQLLHF